MLLFSVCRPPSQHFSLAEYSFRLELIHAVPVRNHENERIQALLDATAAHARIGPDPLYLRAEGVYGIKPGKSVMSIKEGIPAGTEGRPSLACHGLIADPGAILPSNSLKRVCPYDWNCLMSPAPQSCCHPDQR